VHHVGGDTLMDLAGYKKELAIIVMNEKGQPVYRYNVHNAWVSEYTPLADLDGNANAVLIESMKLENEGWERDLAVTEPDESA
jgi:phage tail-like protein